MGRRGRTKEVLKTLQKAYRKKEKRVADEKQVPTLKNFDLERNVDKNDLILYVRDLLGDDKIFKSKILTLKQKRATRLIESIKCPCCGGKIGFDRRWNSFICQNNEKKIYEIVRIDNIYDLMEKNHFKGE